MHMGWLDSLFNTSSDAQDSGKSPGSGWLGPIAGGPPPLPPLPAPQGGSLLDHLVAGATNLTTGGNPLAGLLNAVNGLATGLPDAVAAAAAMNPEVLKTVAPQLYSKPQPHKLKDAYGAERIVFANPDKQTVTEPAASVSGANARGMNVLAPGATYDASLPAEAYLAQFTPEMQDAIKAHVAAGTVDADRRRIAIANAARPFAQHYARKVANAASGVTSASDRQSAATE